jgi:hypothetical protein
MAHITQIVSRLPPAIDGVGDYAYLLARELRAAHNIDTVFIVCDPGWIAAKGTNKSFASIHGGDTTWKASSSNFAAAFDLRPRYSEEGKRRSAIERSSTINDQPATTLDGFPVYQLRTQSAGELFRLLAHPAMPSTVLLQYVGYGYQNRGCPLWLMCGISKWLRQRFASNRPLSGYRHLITMFHELYAFGPPWRSSFWASPIQKWIAKSLAEISAHCFTNLTVNARTLLRLTSRCDDNFTVLPVFSNVGEPEHFPSWDERPPRMIVFGSAGWRRKAYRECLPDLEKACRSMSLNEIIDIGAEVNVQQSATRICKRGILSAAETSREMLSARAGFFAYPINCLGKSGIFAAYAAHGLAPVTFEGNKLQNGDGLVLGTHFVSAANASQGSASCLEAIGKRAREWYVKHSIEAHANAYERYLLRENLHCCRTVAP